ncbi:MAG: hypothetical protein WC701_08980 [Kiritimatiellales bacterium]|jgi:hypothetical protein
MTERTKCSFTVKRGVNDDDFFLVIEPNDASIKILANELISFDFRKKVNARNAKEIENFLNENISHIAFTQISN